MKKMQIATVLLSLICAAALTACGGDTAIGDSTPSVTTEAVTTAAETTAESETETTADAAATTAKETDAAETTEAEQNETTAEAETTAQQETEAPATEAPQQTEAPATDAPKQEQHLFDALKIGGSPADYTAAHKVTPSISDSCLVGKDMEYTYPDFTLLTNENNGVEKVVRITITGNGISTREGIHVGSTLEEVKNAYGAGDSDDFISKTTADGLLEITLENGIVTEIALSAE